jgi:acylphosphatase
VRRRVIVHGRVQGVWFRGSTVKRAHLEGVRGWVRNRRDGSVEAVFEGAPEAVAAMMDFCRTGPRSARVERVEVFEEEEAEALHGFEIV